MVSSSEGGLMQGCIGPLFLFLLFEKEQKDFVHFLRPFSSKRAELERSHAREKEPKSALPPRPPVFYNSPAPLLACKRGYLPTTKPPPDIGMRFKKIIAETADYFYVLVSRDDAMSLL